jgi:hypothetical protein
MLAHPPMTRPFQNGDPCPCALDRHEVAQKSPLTIH